MDNNTSGSGIGITSVLTIVFVILKLTGVIAWSWWLVLLPTIITVGLGIIITIVFGVISGIMISRKNGGR